MAAAHDDTQKRLEEMMYLGHAPTLSLGKRLTLAREDAELDQHELAEMIGVSRRSVSNYERGFTTPDRITILRWGLATGTQAAWILGEADHDHALCPTCGQGIDVPAEADEDEVRSRCVVIPIDHDRRRP